MSNHLRRLSILLAGTALLGACATTQPVTVAEGPAPVAPLAASNEPVAVANLVEQVAIPHQGFRLANGLTVVVHEDRKAPVVAVSMWYNVGSKDEPAGKTGFAHLFEHLMFNGSENLPGDSFVYLQQVGATDYNGTTWFDRTNYFQTVPTGALERTLFLESDRMGYLLGAVTQEKLDNQRGVVQNEKRQGDNQPGGLVDYEVLENLFPEGHPYRHDTIGSMADLDSASLADVQRWFTDKYGPNNAVLVLAGDINAAQARPLVEKYFAAIPAGPVNTPAAADVPTLAAPKSIVMKDRVAAVQIQRHWAVPGLLDKQLAALDLGGSILGGLSSSRLDNALVRDEKIAVSVSAGHQPFHRIGMFEINATVKPGVDPALVEKRIDEILAEFIAKGPTEDEVRRAATSDVAGRIRGLEMVGGFGGKATALRRGPALCGRRRLLQAHAQPLRRDHARPTSRRRWRNGLAARPSASGSSPAIARPTSKPRASPPPRRPRRPRPSAPRVKSRRSPRLPRSTSPTSQHVTLSNGVRVSYAQRNAVPVTQMALSFDAGFSADAPAARGLQSFAVGLLDEGADGMNSQQLAEAQERLGTQIGASGSADRSTVTMSSLSANLAPSLDLLADIVQRPDFVPAEIDRVRAQTLNAIAQAQREPNSIATRALPALLYGETHPYATTALGDAPAVTRFTRDDLVGFQQRWLRPDNLEVFVVSSLPLAELQPMLEARFGTWAAPAVAKGVKAFPALPGAPRQVAHRADRPPGLAPVGHPRGAADPDRPAQRHRHRRQRQRRARRQLPVAHEHGPARGQGLELWRQRQYRADRAGRALHHQRPRPGRPHRRFDPRAQRAGEVVPVDQGRQ